MVCMYICMHVCMCDCVNVRMYVCVRMFVCVYACVCIFLCKCVMCVLVLACDDGKLLVQLCVYVSCYYNRRLHHTVKQLRQEPRLNSSTRSHLT